MKVFPNFFYLFVVFILSGSNLFAQSAISQDNASNYSQTDWIYNSNRGVGFTAWQLPDGSDFAGYLIESSTAGGSGNVNTNGQAFGIYGYNGQGASAVRYFRGTGSIADPGDARSYLLPGQVFSIDIAVAMRNGYKGIDITSDDGSQRLVTFAIDGNTYRFGNPANGNDSQFYTGVNDQFPLDYQSVFKVQAYQLTDDTCEITLTRGDVTVTTGIINGQIGGFKVYASSTSGDDPLNRIYFNNLTIERRCPNETTWTGSGWSNGLPDLDTRAIVQGDLTISEDISACTFTVLSGADVILAEGANLTVANRVAVNAGGTFVIENNANLVQIDNVQNTGAVTVHRNSSAIKRLDYTVWSSPVTGQNLFNFSSRTLPERFFTYDTAENRYVSVPDLGPASPTVFAKAKGYLIRTPNNHPSVPTVWQGTFTGLPNSGTASIPLVTSNDSALRFNMIGNPYPSTISIAKFIERNALTTTGQLWFWRKTNDPDKTSYCTVTMAGYTGNGDLENAELYDPNGIINTGQGFIVKAISASPANVIFNNSLRVANNDNQFFRTNSGGERQMNRFWLNIVREGESYGQTLVNYMTGATHGLDHGIDGTTMGDGTLSIYTIAAETKLAIQGRALPFDVEDTVQLGLSASTAGTLSIKLDKFDGVFAERDIFLKDNVTGLLHNLKDGHYTFVTESGVFNDRFEVVYQNSALGTNNPVAAAGMVVAYKKDGQLMVNTANTTIETVQVYDVTGRLLYNNNTVNAATASVNSIAATGQVVIVKVKTATGTTSSNKVLY
jgi:hypothetical protein